jgi:hypothetical protein
VLANVKTLYANRVRVLPSSSVGSSKTSALTSSFQTSSKMGLSCAKASGPKADRGCENLGIALSVVEMRRLLAADKRDTTELGSSRSWNYDSSQFVLVFWSYDQAICENAHAAFREK